MSPLDLKWTNRPPNTNDTIELSWQYTHLCCVVCLVALETLVKKKIILANSPDQTTKRKNVVSDVMPTLLIKSVNNSLACPWMFYFVISQVINCSCWMDLIISKIHAGCLHTPTQVIRQDFWPLSSWTGVFHLLPLFRLSFRDASIFLKVLTMPTSSRDMNWDKTSQELQMLSRLLSDCKSLTLNVMIQVSQFVSNRQLCH